MKGFILDTDTWIEYFRRRSGVEKHIAETPAEQIYDSEVSIAELTYGALHSQAVEKHLNTGTQKGLELLCPQAKF